MGKSFKNTDLPFLNLVEICGASEETPRNEDPSKSGKQKPQKKAPQERCFIEPQDLFSPDGINIKYIGSGNCWSMFFFFLFGI